MTMNLIWLKTISVLATLTTLFFSVQVKAEAKQLASEIVNPLASEAKLKNGELLYVDFWASWCVPCRKSFPWMNELVSKYRDKGLKVIAVNLDAEKSLANEFLKKYPANFPVIYDPNGKLATAFDVQGMPSSFIIDSNGKILKSQKGFKTRLISEYEKKIANVLNSVNQKN